MLKIRKHRLLLSAIILPVCITAQYSRAGTRKEVIISGTLKNTVKLNIIVYHHNLLSAAKYMQHSEFAILNDSFNIHLPVDENATYFSFAISRRKSPYLSFEYFLISPGDSVHIQESDGDLRFSGSASEKFLCQYMMSKILARRKPGYGGPVIDNFNNLRSQEDSIAKLKLTVLDKFRALFDVFTYNVLKADCMYMPYLATYRNFEYVYRFGNLSGEKERDVYQYYLAVYRMQKIDTANSFVKMYSRNYTEMLLEKTRIDCDFKIYREKIPATKFNSLLLSNIYQKIEHDFRGGLRQRLFGIFFSNETFLNDTLSDCLKKAMLKTRLPYIHDLLKDIARKTTGAKAYNFHLPDSKGKWYRLSDFEGKVVVMDLWYTGCPACPKMAKALRPIIARKDSGTVFISVCIDEKRQTWLESLLTGIYTDPDSINLYEQGKGASYNSLIDYYQITNYPYSIIIDGKGKIFVINPVNSNSTQDWTDSIEAAIKNAKKSL